MKTDRELLELAAKAAGMPPPFGDNGHWSSWISTLEGGHWWDPLTDDGDALRLAVNLNIIISYSVDCTVAYAKRFDIPDQDEWTVGVHGDPEDGLPDMHEAVRRAIVRAAAAIGEAIQ